MEPITGPNVPLPRSGNHIYAAGAVMKYAKEIVTAEIRSTMLGREDHGIPTCFLDLSGDGWGQGFGGYDLRAYDAEKLCELLEVVGVSRWEDLKGKNVRIERDQTASAACKIYRLGHVVKDKWFSWEP